MKKKTLSLLLSVVMVFTMIPFTVLPAGAATVVASGDCNGTSYADIVTWTLTDDGTITFSGTGSSTDFDSETTAKPWDSYKTSIKKVVAEKGIKYIGNYSFYGYPNISEVILSEGVDRLSMYSFYGCTSLKEITLPSTIKYIRLRSFTTSGLSKIYYNGTSAEWNALSVTSNNINYATVIPMLTYHPAVTAACDAPGNVEYYSNSIDGKNYDMDKTTVLSDVTVRVAHTWTATYTWAEDYSSCSVVGKCSECGTTIPSLTDTGVTKKVTAATCTTDGYTTYTAFKNPGSSLYITTQTKIVTNSGTAYGHSETRTDTWSADYSTCTRTLCCSRCGITIAKQTVNTTKSGTAPTCTEDGVMYYYATFTDPLLIKNSATASTRVTTSALNHRPMTPTYTLNADKTEMTAEVLCANDGDILESETATVTAKVVSPLSCTTDGVITYTASFTSSYFESSKTLTETTKATGHNYVDGICTTCGGADPTYLHTNAKGYYEISNASQLLWFSAFVNDGNTSANAVLTVNITFPGTRSWNTIKSYSGTFDGNGYKIYNLRNNEFMASLESGGTVKNLTLDYVNFWLTANDCGGIVGINSGVIENCVVNNPSIQYSGWAGFGGVAGSNTEAGVIRNCAVIGGTLMLRYSAANNPGGNSMGGVCGINSGKIENCYVYNTNLANGVTHGAIVFKAQEGSTVENCYYNNSGYDATAGGTAMTTAQFQSGEVAAMLQDGCTETTWGQGDDDTTPVLTSDETLVKRRVTFKYNDTSSTQILKYGEKATLPKVETEDGSAVLYWLKSDGTVFRVTENVVSGSVLTAIMSYTKLVAVNNSYLTLDRTNNAVLSEAVQSGRTVKDYKDNFKNDNSLIVIEDADGNVLSDSDLVGTGCVIKGLYEFDGETVLDSLTVVIMGDINGDGLISDGDYAIVKSNMFNCSLDSVYFTAADIYKDGVIDAFDLSLTDLSNSSVNGKLKYTVTSEQTLTQLKEHFGEDIIVYNAQGEIVTEESTLLGSDTKVEYQRNGITISRIVEITAS